MSKYETLIFDLDDTLIDNNQSIKYAFTIMIGKLGLEYSDELYLKWKKFDTSYWNIWESGKMYIPETIKTLEDKITYLRANRFILFFKDIQLDFDTAVSLNELYCCMLGVNIHEIENANRLLSDVYSSYEILVATNGPREAAINKLEKSKLNPYISGLVCSEDVGFSKPMPEFFDYLYDITENKDKTKMLLIGDSLTTDILGGMNNGIDTCWFNPNNSFLPDEYHPTMTISNLLQLKKKI
ncbi:MAG: HAD-IA family hydrolase [bacterium]|nr:HAD-IA family hydrolase [bacterium]